MMNRKGYMILVKGERKGPFRESSILNGIRSGMVPLTAKIIDLDTEEEMTARDLIGDPADTGDFSATAPLFDGEF